MSVIPVDSEQFSEFIEQSKIFEITEQFTREYLLNWYNDDAETFLEDMRTDLSAVLKRYRFRNEFISITKNFNFAPPIDTVSCTIHISDEDDDYCARYTAVFDDQLNVIDDYVNYPLPKGSGLGNKPIAD